MNGLAKLAVTVGSKLISLVLLTISCIAVIASFLWQTQHLTSDSQQQQHRIAQQTQKMIHGAISQHINAFNDQMAALAQSPEVINALNQRDPDLIMTQQRQLGYLLPQSTKVCLLSATVDQPDASACIAITFATLNSLRQAKKDGSAEMAILQLGSDDAHLLLAQRVVDTDNRVLGVLVAAFKPSVVTDLLLKEYAGRGYVELQQGTEPAIKLVSQGDQSLKQGHAPIELMLPSSHWRIAYWPEDTTQSSQTILLLIVVIALMVIIWWLYGQWRTHLITIDAATLKRQIDDLTNKKLQPKYAMVNPALQQITQAINLLSRPIKEPVKKTEIAKKVVKKVVQAEPEKAMTALEVNEQPIVIDPIIFKAYDIRGVVGKTLDETIVRVLGQAIASEALNQGQHRLVVGRDGRLSSDDLTNALINGILSTGCDVIDIGQVPTPLVYFACEHLGTHSGVMVTASHNPSDYNGLKIVIAGKSLSGEALQQLYQRIQQSQFASGQGTKNTVDIIDEYIKRIAGDVKISRSVKVVVDGGNGVAGLVAPKLLQALGCEVIELHCEVDGHFPNHQPNPSHPENLQDLVAAVQQSEAELGIAFDGDGDRIGVVDTNGAAIWPDRLMILFAQDMLSRQPGATVIYDVKSTHLLSDAIFRAGGEAVMSASGYAVIKNKMEALDAQLAGELSGHIFFKERWYGFDDGLYTVCRLLEILAADPLERTPTEILSAIPNRQNTPEIMIDMAEGENHAFMQQFIAEANFTGAQLTLIDGLRAEYPYGWGLVRASNTMPGITLRFEADTPDNLHDIQQQFKQQILQVKPTLTLLF